MWSKYLSNNVRRNFRFPMSASVMPDGKTIFGVNLPSELFRATVVNANTGSLKSLNTIFDTFLDYMLLTKKKQNKTKNRSPLNLFLTKQL